VRFAAAHRMLCSVRGGGHHIAGNAVAEGGLMIDLSGMRAIHIEPAQRTARVGAGALLADLDRATQAHGLATPLGINSTTGVAGLTLGGGFGWLTRRHGMTIDNLLGATVVTADAAVHAVSATAQPELFWALRGGGGNFGVVTSFEFRLHPVGPEVHAGLVVYPLAQARQVLHAWRAFTATMPDELSVWAVLRKAPPLPFLPASAHGTEVVIFPVVHSGELEAGRRAAAPVLQFGEPLGAALGPTPYAGFQAAFDPLLAPGGRNYWKSNNFSRLDDAVLAGVIEAAARLPGPECEIFIAHLGGAMARVKPAATAFVSRNAQYIMNVHGRWSDPRDDARVRTWARQAFEQVAPHAIGSGYVNFLTEDEGERVAASYGTNYPRLQALKQRFDPTNLFRMNLNIAPAAVPQREASS
jgi:FAD/FMN-containing dehydrogenase